MKISVDYKVLAYLDISLFNYSNHSLIIQAVYSKVPIEKSNKLAL
jgi:hypothetical protein